jgi:hypothetical protein
MISQTLKDNSEMFGVIFLALRIDENIIDKDHDKFIKLCHEHRVHEVHEVGGGISESERRYQEHVKCRMDLPGPTASVGTRTDYGLPGLRCTAPKGVEHKDCTGVVLG